jgi:hypothetical protein
MRRLERQAQALAAQEGDAFLPNFRPGGPVDYVLICMEPSLGRWAKTPEVARERVAKGFRNFTWSIEDFILHTAVRRYLCGPGQTYHLTDVAKGAMLVKRAQVDRPARYARWYGLLEQEIEAVAKPTAKFFAVGQAVDKELRRLRFARSWALLIHYSGQAARARKTAVAVLVAEFRRYAKTVSLGDVLQVAEELLRENNVPAAMTHETMERLRRAKFTESRKMLLFIYRNAFLEVHAGAGRT